MDLQPAKYMIISIRHILFTALNIYALPAILATQEAETGKITDRGQLKQIISPDIPQTPICKIKTVKWTGGVAQSTSTLAKQSTCFASMKS
jgi:hypothetical protein